MNSNFKSKNEGDKKLKTSNLSFLSGLIAFALILTLLTPMTTTYAADSGDGSVRDDVYNNNVRDDVYDVRDDVYEEDEFHEEDSSEEETVTENVYKIFTEKGSLANLQDKNGEINLPGTKTLYMDSPVIQELDDNVKINMSYEGVHLSIPASVLKELTADTFRGVISLEDVTSDYENVEGLVSNVYKFNLGLGYESYDGEFSEPFIVTFTVDPNKVTNWNDLVLRYFEDDGSYTDYKDQVISYNPETGEVVVEVYHFSEYGIVEVPGAGNQAVNAVTGETNDTSGSTEDEDSSESAATGTNGPGSELPQTATSMFNLLAIGASLMLIGFVLFIRNRKTKAVENV